MPIKKVKSNSNGKKLPTAKDYENLKIILSDEDKKRVASTKSVLKEMLKDSNEKARV